ncbi:hypothetical protein L0F63_006084, partial [Massospora cicadina]
MGYDTNSAYPPNQPPPSKVMGKVHLNKVLNTLPKVTRHRVIHHKATLNRVILNRGMLPRPLCNLIRHLLLNLLPGRVALMAYALDVPWAPAVVVASTCAADANLSSL